MRRRVAVIVPRTMFGMLVAGGLAVGVFIAVKFTDQSAAPAHTTDQDASPSLTDTFLTMIMNTFRTLASIPAKSTNTPSVISFHTASASISTALVSTSESPKYTSTTSTAPISAPKIGGSSRAVVEKRTYTGDGDHGWPTKDEWLSIDELWSKNYDIMGKYCSEINGVPTMPTTDAEKAVIKDTVIKLDSEYHDLDARFILAIMMQESEGCVRTIDTHSPDGIRNPGLMQSHNGNHACYNLEEACPNDAIVGMIMDSTCGTYDQPGGGDGLVQCLAKAKEMGAKEGSAQQYYIAARLYNSGTYSYTFGDALEGGQVDTSSYVSDIANRFRGCVG